MLFDYLGPECPLLEVVAKALSDVCATGATDNDEGLCSAVVVPTLKFFFGNDGRLVERASSSAILGALAKGVAKCARVATVPEQTELLSVFRRVLVENDLKPLELAKRKQAYIPGARGGGVAEGGDLILLFRAFIVNLRPDVVTFDLWQSLQSALIEAVLVFDEGAATAAAISLASLLNKLDPDDDVRTALSTALERLESAPGVELRAGIGRAFLTKAVAVRGHSATKELLDRLISDLKDASKATHVARMFGIIANDEAEDGDRAFSRVTFMHKQRLYAQTSSALIAGYSSGAGIVRSSHLVALVHLLVAVPRQVLLNEVGTVWQLMLEALRSQEDEDVVMCVLQLMKTLLTEAQDRVSENSNTIVATLLPLCSAERMKTRLAALDCLTMAATLPPARIFPLAEDVIRGLAPVLDDKKRLVRQKAVACRAAWFLIGGTA